VPAEADAILVPEVVHLEVGRCRADLDRFDIGTKPEHGPDLPGPALQ
jgi:hypothetical protein